MGSIQKSLTYSTVLEHMGRGDLGVWLFKIYSLGWSCLWLGV